MSYYKIIGGVRYERTMLDAADASAKTGQQISLREIENLYKMAMDKGRITDTERRTLIYISKMYKLSENARAWIDDQLGTNDPGTIEATIQKVIRDQWGLKNLKIEADPLVVQAYQKSSTRSLESVFYGAIDAYLNKSFNQLGFSVVVKRRDLAFETDPNPAARLKGYLDTGTLYLVPMDAAQHANLPYDLPEKLDFDNFWIFALVLEAFEPLVFHAFVLRHQNAQHNRGSFSRKADIQRVTEAAIVQFAQFPQLKWNIDPAEVERQLPIVPGQNFGNALFAAVDSGIFNRESSVSFGDFVQAEVWSAPTLDITDAMREYVGSGTLHLIPMDYRAQTEAGTASFPVPDQFAFWLDGEWIFGLEMPGKTDFRVILSAPRDGNDGQLAWSDAFFDEGESLDARIKRVVDREFKVDGLRVRINEAAFEAQRQQYGPDWSRAQVLLRRAINTLLFDTISKNGVFNSVAKRHESDISADHFDDPEEYKAAIRNIIGDYLREEGSLEMVAAQEEDEKKAPYGESIEQYWFFKAVLPNLLDHYFWVILPRWPEEGQLPYIYVD
jgi:hypothetical protein